MTIKYSKRYAESKFPGGGCLWGVFDIQLGEFVRVDGVRHFADRRSAKRFAKVMNLAEQVAVDRAIAQGASQP